MATSGISRQPEFCTPSWKVASDSGSSMLCPPPPSLQPVSLLYVLLALRFRLVPPTATTLGEKAGYPPGAPLSPVEAQNVTPVWPAGVVYNGFWATSAPAPTAVLTNDSGKP